MLNPILSQLNKLPMNNITSVINILKGKDPNAMLDYLVKNNPQFKAFYDKNKDKTAEQIAEAYGLDYNEIKSFL